jgi:peptidoglycan/LPS O-acetylase OafA/YrhL
MSTKEKAKFSEIILVVLGFVLWLVIGAFLDDKTDQHFDLSFFAGTIIFFFIAFFIAEKPPRSFLNRSQIIAVAAIMLWLVISASLQSKANSTRPFWDWTDLKILIAAISITASIAFYWASIFLISSYHTEPKHKNIK